MRRHIALINPPASDFYSRAYFCSKVAKARYLEPVTDLVIISGNLFESGYDLSFIDGIAERCSPESVVERVRSEEPLAAVVMLGSASWHADIDFVRKLKHGAGCSIIAIGDLFLEDAEKHLARHPEIDAVTLDFTENNIPLYLEGRDMEIRSMVYRRDGGIIRAPGDMGRREYTIGLPRHELFQKYTYQFPFSRRSPYAVLLTDYGCPFNCAFCIQRRDILGFKLRALSEVIRDLDYIHRLGFGEFWMADLTFGFKRERTIDLLKRMIKLDFTIPWWCLSRVDVMDEEMLALMKEAGCFLVIFGLESASNEILRAYNKVFTKEKAVETIRLCKKIGIETAATFIIGFPEDTRETVEQLLRFAIEVDPDYASFNLATPKITTPLRELMLKEHLADDVIFDLDQTRRPNPTRQLSREEVALLRKRAIRQYYLRPGYLVKRLTRVSSLASLLRQGYYGIRALIQ